MNESSDREDNPIEELHQHVRMHTQTHTDRGRWGRVVRSFFLAPVPMKPSLSLVPWEAPAFSFEIVGYTVQGAGKAVLGDTSWSAQSSYYKPSFAVKKCFLVGKKPRLWYYSGGSSLICGNPRCRGAVPWPMGIHVADTSWFRDFIRSIWDLWEFCEECI